LSKKKGYLKMRYLRWTAYALIIAGVGMLLALMWQQHGIDFISEHLNREKPESRREIEKRFIVQRLNEICEHHSLETMEQLPPEFEEEDVMSYLGGDLSGSEFPENWHLAHTEAGDGKEIYITVVDELCEDCSEERYLGEHNGKIAIYKGIPPDGVLLEELEHEVKEVYEEELKKGVPYRTEEEKIKLLETYTT